MFYYYLLTCVYVYRPFLSIQWIERTERLFLMRLRYVTVNKPPIERGKVSSQFLMRETQKGYSCCPLLSGVFVYYSLTFPYYFFFFIFVCFVLFLRIIFSPYSIFYSFFLTRVLTSITSRSSDYR